jgi:hypothetical protein
MEVCYRLDIITLDLGHSETASKNIPEMIPNLVDIVQIFAAGNTSIVKNDSQQFLRQYFLSDQKASFGQNTHALILLG